MYLRRSFRIFYPAHCMRNYVTMHGFIGRRQSRWEVVQDTYEHGVFPTLCGIAYCS
jgi:hypothetical protein